jgi:hypothetical protein
LSLPNLNHRWTWNAIGYAIRRSMLTFG